MGGLPDVPLAPEAQRLMEEIRPAIDAGLAEVRRVPVSVLLWGPGIDSESPLGRTRLDLRLRLRGDGHAAYFSEELCDPESEHSVRIQQIVQAREFDLIVSIPCTPGSIAEVHDFVLDRRAMAKMLVFLNQQHVQGYSPQSLQAISTLLTCRLAYYPSEERSEPIVEIVQAEVQRIRELKFILGGRYLP